MPPNPRVAKAFRAMRDLGILEDKVKPVLKSLLKLYDKNWDLIEEENYRVLADAIFDSEEAEQAAPTKNKLENTEQERVLQEEAQEQDEPGPPLKRLCHGQASESCNISIHLAGTSLITPKDEPVELSEAQPQNQVRSMVSTKPLNNGSRWTEPQQASFESLNRRNGKQPVSPKPLTFREKTDSSQPVNGSESQTNIPATIESVTVPHPPNHKNSGKEALSPHAGSVEEGWESGQPSQTVPQEKTVGAQIYVQPKEKPFTGDTPVLDLPLADLHPEKSKEGDPSRKSCLGPVQNGSVPLEESIGGKDTSGGVPSQLEVASSRLGEVKICLSYNVASLKPDFQVPSLDAVVKLVEDKCLKSYKQEDPNFSIMNLMKDMCETVLELGFESCNKSGEETN